MHGLHRPPCATAMCVVKSFPFHGPMCVVKAFPFHVRRCLWHKCKIAVMATLSRRPAKEQPPADMRDDKTANTDHTHIPLPSLAPSITCPASDRCDIAGALADVSVPPLRRSAPAISRFCPVLGWRTMLQLFARRAAESNAFSIRNALWSSAEDDLLVQAVAKHSTLTFFFLIGARLHGSCPGALSSSAESATGLL